MRMLVCFFIATMFFQQPAFAGDDLKPSNDEKSEVQANRLLWQQKTCGENLALGKRVKFCPEPNYFLTAKGSTAATVLTDGKLGRNDDRLWFEPTAVAWVKAGTTNASALIDLEKIEPVSKIVIRLNGGWPGNGVRFPQMIEVFVSKDGKTFYSARKIIKLEPADQNLADWQNTYYLPENGEPYVYPFDLMIDADVRYVGVCFSGITIPAISDEIAVIKANTQSFKDDKFNAVYSKTPTPFWEEKAVFSPRTENFYIADNINAPNWLQLKDQRQDTKGELGYVIDMPSQVKFHTPQAYPLFLRKLVNTEIRGARTIRTFKFDLQAYQKSGITWVGPLYFSVKTDDKIPEQESYVIVTTTENGKEHYSCKLPLKLLHINEVPMLKRIHVSLAWMYLHEMQEWPDFFADWRKLGFNTVSIMPCANDNEREQEAKCRFMENAKRQGYKIISILSPLGRVSTMYPKDTEYRCVGSSNPESFCPSYKGKIYDSILSFIRDSVKKYPTDYVFFDVESWPHPGMLECIKCSRCNEKRNTAGQSWQEYLTSFQVDLALNFHECIVEGSRERKTVPVIGYYDSYPGRSLMPVVGGVPFLPFEQLYPKYSDLAQPSLYTSEISRIKSTICQCYEYTKKHTAVIPWLTAGTYGEFDSYKLEHIILETLLNGAGGFTYYCFSDFDTPLDYYSHAQALGKIAPYESLLADGEPVKISGSNSNLSYSAVRHGGRMLLMVGNYGKISKTDTTIPLPFKKISTIIDLNAGRTIQPANALSVSLQPDSFGLFYVEEQQ